MTKTTEDIADIEFIIAEIQRLKSLSTNELRDLFRENKFDWLRTFPGTDGGSLLCGKEADTRVSKLALRHLGSQTKLKGRVSHERFVGLVKTEITRTFLKQNKVINERYVAKMLSNATKAVSRDITNLTVFVPCVLVSSKVPESFEIGPVRFTRMERFLRENRDAINAKEIGGPALLEYFATYQWLAEVSIPNYDAETSKLRASVVVEGALNVLRLLIGRSSSFSLRQGHYPSAPLKTAWLSRMTNDQLRITASWRSDDLPAEDNWFHNVKTKAGHFLAPAENAIRSLVEPAVADPLTQRFLDALTWYGQAIQELEPAPTIVKCVAALERLTMTAKKQEKDLSKTLVTRTALLACDGDPNAYENIVARAKAIYDLRSKLMHGAMSPYDEKVRGACNEPRRPLKFPHLWPPQIPPPIARCRHL